MKKCAYPKKFTWNLFPQVSTNNFVLYYVDNCVYWYTNEDIGKWFVDTLGQRSHVNLLGYANWFSSIRISQMKDNSIYVDQSKYSTYIVEKYLDTAAVKENKKVIRPH